LISAASPTVILVVDDYGHHPDIDRRGPRGAAARFQPGVIGLSAPRFTRTAFVDDAFCPPFARGPTTVVLPDISIGGGGSDFPA